MLAWLSAAPVVWTFGSRFSLRPGGTPDSSPAIYRRVADRWKSQSLGLDLLVPEEFLRPLGLNSLASVICEICVICRFSLISVSGLKSPLISQYEYVQHQS